MASDYESIRERVHSGEVMMPNGKRYEDCTEEEKEAFDNRIDELKAKQAETEENEKKDKEDLEKFKNYCHENVKTSSGKSYDEMNEKEKAAFDEAVEETYYKKKESGDSDDNDDTDTEQNADHDRGMERSKKNRDDDDIDYSR